MTLQAVIARARQFVNETFLYTQSHVVLGDHDRLLDVGVMDSMGVLELIGFLESEFGIAVGAEDVNEENLGTLANIGRYVTSRSAHWEQR